LVVRDARDARDDVPSFPSSLSDDGVGFGVNGSFPGPIGLQSMRERAARLGGMRGVVSAPQRGSQVRADVPRNPV
jgi:signal transduction histidine kinase